MKASACQASNGVWYNSFCCAGGWNPGVSAPPVTSPPSSSPSRTRPAAVSSPEAEAEDGVRGGSRAGLTLWPPTAGAEAATRPASLKDGGRGQRGNKHKGETGYILLCCVTAFYWSHRFPLPFASSFISLPSSISVLAAAFLTLFRSDWGPHAGPARSSCQDRCTPAVLRVADTDVQRRRG